jgi:hypothetical protein
VFRSRFRPRRAAAGARNRGRLGVPRLQRRAGYRRFGRAHTLAQFPKLTRHFFTDDYEVVPQAAELLAKETTPAALKAALAALEVLPDADWTPAGLDPLLRDAAKAAGMGFGKLAQPLRAAVTGTNVSPGFFDVLEFLGRDVTLAPVKRAVGQGGDGRLEITGPVGCVCAPYWVPWISSVDLVVRDSCPLRSKRS